jgi:hypothetical protein
MIVDAHAQQARGFDDLVGDLDVGPAGLGASRGMVVHEDQRRRADGEGLGDDLAGVDRAFIEGAIAHDLVEQQAVLGVEIEHPHALVVEVGHVDRQIVDQGLPARQHGHLLDLRAGEPARGDPGDAQGGGGGLLDAGHRLERARIGVEHARQRAESLEQHPRERFDIHARDHGHQQGLDHLVIGQRIVAAAQQPFAQPGAMAAGIVCGLAHAVGHAGGRRGHESFRKEFAVLRHDLVDTHVAVFCIAQAGGLRKKGANGGFYRYGITR